MEKYSISQCFKDIEQLFKRPISSTEYMRIASWFDNFESEHVKLAMSIANTRSGIYSVGYIEKILNGTLETYKANKAMQETPNDKVITPKSSLSYEVVANSGYMPMGLYEEFLNATKIPLDEQEKYKESMKVKNQEALNELGITEEEANRILEGK